MKPAIDITSIKKTASIKDVREDVTPSISKIGVNLMGLYGIYRKKKFEDEKGNPKAELIKSVIEKREGGAGSVGRGSHED